jgi:uncharacterized protein DUF5763
MRGTCRAITKSGKPCRARPTANGFYLFHSSPTKAAELGRAGGQKNRRPRMASAMPKQDGAASAIERLDLICIELRNDVISPAKANVLLKATYQQAELQHKMVVEEHMAKTQRQIEDLKLLVAKLSDDNLMSEDESREDEDHKESEDQKP